MGDEFALNSTVVLQLLTFGVLIHSLGKVPYAMIQGAGRPDWTAKLHFLELLIYTPVLWLFTKHFGIKGVAILWVLRVVIDSACLNILARKLTGAKRLRFNGHALFVMVSFCIMLFATTLSGFHIKLIFIVISLLTFFLYAYFIFLTAAERRFLHSMSPFVS